MAANKRPDQKPELRMLKSGHTLEDLCKAIHYKNQILEQYQRARAAQSNEGTCLVQFLEQARKVFLEQRGVADPDDVRWNTILYARVELLDKILDDWLKADQMIPKIQKEIINLKKQLDILVTAGVEKAK